MLRSFRVANHKSLRDEQELLLMPAYDKTRPVVPVAAVFGANASGKSNFLDSLAFMQAAVRTSYAEWEPGGGIPRTPFRLDPDRADLPSVFCVELMVEGSRYTYGFELDDDVVREEWLYAYPVNRKRVVFERRGDAWTFGSAVARSRADSVRDLTRANTLFLSVAARSRLNEVAPVYAWFQSLRYEAARSRLRPSVNALGQRLRADAPERTAVLRLVQRADLGISDVQVHTYEQLSLFGDTELEAKNGARRSKVDMELRFAHGSALLSLAEQSHGTIAWLRLIVPVLTALESGSTLLIDELDSSLHPRLTARLIELFRSEETNPRHAQLVFSTHDAALLGTSFGREILARDEIWFIEKDQTGASTLFPLTDFHPRKEENTERRYIGGSYGAVPAIFSDTLVDELVAVRSEAERAAT